MAEIQIKAESLPERCEICHQDDCFDSSINYCSRCSTTSDELSNHNDKSLDKITINFYLDRKLYFELGFWPTYKWYANLFVIVFIILALLIFNGNYSNSKLYGFIIFLMFCYLVAIPGYSYHSLERHYTKIKDSMKNIRYTFSSDGIESSNGKSFSHIVWDSVDRVEESKKIFKIITKGKAICLLPKRYFNNNEEIIRLRNLLIEKLKNRAEVK